MSRLRLALPRPVLLVLLSSNRFVHLIPQQATAIIVGAECILFELTLESEVVAVVFRQS